MTQAISQVSTLGTAGTLPGVAGAEYIVATLPAASTQPVGGRNPWVRVRGVVAITPAPSTTAVALRVRLGGLGGPALTFNNDQRAIPAVPGTGANMTVEGYDIGGTSEAGAGQVYVITAQEIGATAISASASTAIAVAEVLT